MPEILETTAPVGLRQRKKLETLRRLRRTALTLALKHGVEHVTVEDIAAAADVSPRTFFNYFTCKEDALIGRSGAVREEIRAAILARPADEPALDTLRFAIGHSEILRSAHARREESLARQRLVHAHPALLARQIAQAQALEAAIAEGMAERLGADPGDAEPQLLAAVANAVLRVALRRWSSGGETRLDAVIDDAFAALGARLLTDDHRTTTGNQATS